MPQIEVTFDIDANGIVNVSAKDKATGKEQQIRIQASGGLSDDEIEGMVSDAESHAEEDAKRRAEVEARNQADALVHATEQQLAEHGDKVESAVKTEIEEAITDLKSELEKEADDADVEAIESKTQVLVQASMKLGEEIYKAEQAEAGDGGDGEEGAQGGASDDGVVDAEFEEVDDDDKKSGTA